MNYTENYHLPQWVKADRIMMEDFNTAMSDIETGLSANAQAAEAAAKLPYVVGSYVGNGEKNRHFSLGFRPSFLIAGALLESSGGMTGAAHYFVASCGGVTPNQLKFTDDGFTVNCSDFLYPDLNHIDYAYDYIAFR